MATPVRMNWAALVLVLLTACSSAAEVDQAPSVKTATSPSPSSPAPVPAVGLDQTYRSSDGVVADITEIRIAKLEPLPVTEDPKAKAGDPYVLFTTTTTNTGKTTVQVVPGAVLTYGADRTRAAEVNVGDETEGSVPVRPGEKFEFAFGFLVPAESRDQITMEFTISIDPLRTAVFSGSVQPG